MRRNIKNHNKKGPTAFQLKFKGRKQRIPMTGLQEVVNRPDLKAIDKNDGIAAFETDINNKIQERSRLKVGEQVHDKSVLENIGDNGALLFLATARQVNNKIQDQPGDGLYRRKFLNLSRIEDSNVIHSIQKRK